MKKYYFKSINNIEFLWQIRTIDNDPYREGDSIAELLANNTPVHVKWILKNEQDLAKHDFLKGFKEVSQDKFNEDGVIYDEIIGVIRKDEKFPVLYSYRKINYLDKIVPVEFENDKSIKTVRKLFLKVLNAGTDLREKIIKTAFTYYKNCGFEEHLSVSELNETEFLNTIELSSVSIEDIENEQVQFYFRPSWDEEHGLYVMANLKDNSCEVEM